MSRGEALSQRQRSRRYTQPPKEHQQRRVVASNETTDESGTDDAAMGGSGAEEEGSFRRNPLRDGSEWNTATTSSSASSDHRYTKESRISVDICATCLTDSPPKLPLREELPSLGFEVIYRAAGVGNKAVHHHAKRALSEFRKRQQQAQQQADTKKISKKRFVAKSTTKRTKEQLADRKRQERKLQMLHACSYESYDEQLHRVLSNGGRLSTSNSTSSLSIPVIQNASTSSGELLTIPVVQSAPGPSSQGKKDRQRRHATQSRIRRRWSQWLQNTKPPFLLRTSNKNSIDDDAAPATTIEFPRRDSPALNALLRHAQFVDYLAPVQRSTSSKTEGNDKAHRGFLRSKRSHRRPLLRPATKKPNPPESNDDVEPYSDMTSEKRIDHKHTNNRSGYYQSSKQDNDAVGASVAPGAANTTTPFDSETDGEHAENLAGNSLILTSAEPPLRQHQHTQQSLYVHPPIQRSATAPEHLSSAQKPLAVVRKTTEFHGAVHAKRTASASRRRRHQQHHDNGAAPAALFLPTLSPVLDPGKRADPPEQPAQQPKSTAPPNLSVDPVKSAFSSHPARLFHDTVASAFASVDVAALDVPNAGVPFPELDLRVKSAFASVAFPDIPTDEPVTSSGLNRIVQSAFAAVDIPLLSSEQKNQQDTFVPIADRANDVFASVDIDALQPSRTTSADIPTTSYDETFDKTESTSFEALHLTQTDDTGVAQTMSSSTGAAALLEATKKKRGPGRFLQRGKKRGPDEPLAGFILPFRKERASRAAALSLQRCDSESFTPTSGVAEISMSMAGKPPMIPSMTNTTTRNVWDARVTQAFAHPADPVHPRVPADGDHVQQAFSSMDLSKSSRHRSKESAGSISDLSKSFDDGEEGGDVEDEEEDDEEDDDEEEEEDKEDSEDDQLQYSDETEIIDKIQQERNKHEYSLVTLPLSKQPTDQHMADLKRPIEHQADDPMHDWLTSARSAFDNIAAKVYQAAGIQAVAASVAPAETSLATNKFDIGDLFHAMGRVETTPEYAETLIRSYPEFLQVKQQDTGRHVLHALCDRGMPDRSSVPDKLLCDDLLKDVANFRGLLELAAHSYPAACLVVDRSGDLPVHLVARRLMEWEAKWYEAVYQQATKEKDPAGTTANAISKLYQIMSACIEELLQPLRHDTVLCRQKGSVGTILPLHIAAIFTSSVKTLRTMLEAYPDAAGIPCDLSILRTFVPDGSLPLVLHDTLSTDFPKWEIEAKEDLNPEIKWSQSRNPTQSAEDCVRRSDLLFAYFPVEPYRFEKARIRRFESRIQFEATRLPKGGASYNPSDVKLCRATGLLWIWMCTFTEPDTGRPTYVNSVRRIVAALPMRSIRVLALVEAGNGRAAVDAANPECAKVIQRRLDRIADSSAPLSHSQLTAAIQEKRTDADELIKSPNDVQDVRAPITDIGFVAAMWRLLFNVKERSMPTSFVVLPYELIPSPDGAPTISADSVDAAAKFKECLVELTDPKLLIHFLDDEATKQFGTSILNRKTKAVETKIRELEDRLVSMYHPGRAYLYLIDEVEFAPIAPISQHVYPIVLNNPSSLVRKLLPLMAMGMVMMRGANSLSVLMSILLDKEVIHTPQNWTDVAKQINTYGFSGEGPIGDSRSLHAMKDALQRFASTNPSLILEDQLAGLGWNVELSIYKMLIDMNDPLRTFGGMKAVTCQRESFVWTVERNRDGAASSTNISPTTENSKLKTHVQRIELDSAAGLAPMDGNALASPDKALVSGSDDESEREEQLVEKDVRHKGSCPEGKGSDKEPGTSVVESVSTPSANDSVSTPSYKDDFESAESTSGSRNDLPGVGPSYSNLERKHNELSTMYASIQRKPNGSLEQEAPSSDRNAEVGKGQNGDELPKRLQQLEALYRSFSGSRKSDTDDSESIEILELESSSTNQDGSSLGDDEVSENGRIELGGVTSKYNLLFGDLAIRRDSPDATSTEVAEKGTVWKESTRLWDDLTANLDRSGEYYGVGEIIELKYKLASEAKKLAILGRKVSDIKIEEQIVTLKGEETRERRLSDTGTVLASANNLPEMRRLLIRLCSLEDRILCNQIDVQHLSLNAMGIDLQAEEAIDHIVQQREDSGYKDESGNWNTATDNILDEGSGNDLGVDQSDHTEDEVACTLHPSQQAARTSSPVNHDPTVEREHEVEWLFDGGSCLILDDDSQTNRVSFVEEDQNNFQLQKAEVISISDSLQELFNAYAFVDKETIDAFRHDRVSPDSVIPIIDLSAHSDTEPIYLVDVSVIGKRTNLPNDAIGLDTLKRESQRYNSRRSSRFSTPLINLCELEEGILGDELALSVIQEDGSFSMKSTSDAIEGDSTYPVCVEQLDEHSRDRSGSNDDTPRIMQRQPFPQILNQEVESAEPTTSDRRARSDVQYIKATPPFTPPPVRRTPEDLGIPTKLFIYRGGPVDLDALDSYPGSISTEPDSQGFYIDKAWPKEETPEIKEHYQDSENARYVPIGANSFFVKRQLATPSTARTTPYSTPQTRYSRGLHTGKKEIVWSPYASRIHPISYDQAEEQSARGHEKEYSEPSGAASPLPPTTIVVPTDSQVYSPIDDGLSSQAVVGAGTYWITNSGRTRRTKRLEL